MWYVLELYLSNDLSAGSQPAEQTLGNESPSWLRPCDQWRANMMGRCGSCHTKKSCSLRIYPQRYTFRSDLRWQADKQRKHQNWLSLIENCIIRQVLFVCISKLHIFFNYSFIFSSHPLWEHCNVNLHCIEKNLTIRNLSYQKKGFRDLKRILNHFEVSQHTTKL